MNTTSRAKITGAGDKSGGNIAKRRRHNTLKTPYDRPPPQSPENFGIKQLSSDFFADTSRMIAKGAIKFLTFMTDTDHISSSSETEDDDDVVSCDDDVYAPFEVSKWIENDSTSTEMVRMSPKWVIGKLLLQETFSKKESDKLIEIINSRVVDCFPMGEGQDAGLIEMPRGKCGTDDRCGTAVMQDKHWLNKKACPPCASPSLRPSGLRTPSPMATDHYKDEALSTLSCTSFPSTQERGTHSARSWNIQDEVRKVRFKAAEDILHAFPSKKIGLSINSEQKTFQNSIVPGGGSTVDKMQLSKSLPDKEDVDASVKLLSGPSTIHDSKDSFDFGLKQDGMQAEHLFTNPSTSVSEPNQHLTVEGASTSDSHHSMNLEHLVEQHNENDTNSEDGISRRFDVANSGAPVANSLASLRSSLRLRLSAGTEHDPKQTNSKLSTYLRRRKIHSTAEGSQSQDLQNSAYKGAMKISTAGKSKDREQGFNL
ncbi:protein KAKU4 isoform X5 [Daucus carota subsp. sativus]|uniref:protein KAKU4 isoform X5 n=1 Tax=Daucus carota subsp. sativus TaxID=79200 RepID=UPI0007EF388D|nr:PREDICTED: protein KAKU4-like isoform X1 [Daucus carota subsp. sativus]